MFFFADYYELSRIIMDYYIEVIWKYVEMFTGYEMDSFDLPDGKDL